MVSDKQFDLYLSPDILELPDGYSLLKVAPKAFYRYMTPDEARKLSPGDEVNFKSNDGSARRVRCSGKVRTWKRTPDRLEIPFKYGMYESALFVARDGRMMTDSGVALIVRIK